MGGYDGIGLCTPSAVSKAAKYLPVHITAITANNQKITTDSSVRYTQNIELSYKENNLSFEFSDYSYDHIKKGNFVYKLEGLDKDWRQVDERSNRISYTNIPHGKYTLFIRHAGDRQKQLPCFRLPFFRRGIKLCGQKWLISLLSEDWSDG